MVEGELRSGESILWATPEKESRFRRRLLYGTRGSLILAALAIGAILLAILRPSGFYLELEGTSVEDPTCIGVVGVLLLLAGLYQAMPALLRLFRGQRAIYVVTSERALILDPTGREEPCTFGPEQLRNAVKHREPDGSGDLIIEQEMPEEGRGAQTTFRAGFFGVEGVDEVAELVREVAVAERPVREEDEREAPTHAHYYALEAGTFKNRLFKLFITGDALYGAKVGGTFCYEAVQGYARYSGFLGLLLMPVLDLLQSRREEVERRYRAVDPASPEFLAADENNFRIPGGDIDSAVVKEEYGSEHSGIPKSGRLELLMRDRSKRKFILIGEQDLVHLAGLLQPLVPDVDVIRK